MSQPVRIAIIGAGAVADYHHVPGIRLDPRARLVAACDPNEQLLQQRKSDWNITKTTTDFRAIANDPEIDAVIICTPNDTHHPIALACLEGGKHVMCEKPLGLNFAESQAMYRAAQSRGLRHMTAFTYRFAPSMRYLRHLLYTGALGVPRHFRSQRFLDWPETSWGWRQYKKNAGAGDLFDLTFLSLPSSVPSKPRRAPEARPSPPRTARPPTPGSQGGAKWPEARNIRASVLQSVAGSG